jgi:hypothetical protein
MSASETLTLAGEAFGSMLHLMLRHVRVFVQAINCTMI